jgi:hypothetical protein
MIRIPDGCRQEIIALRPKRVDQVGVRRFGLSSVSTSGDLLRRLARDREREIRVGDDLRTMPPRGLFAREIMSAATAVSLSHY